MNIVPGDLLLAIDNNLWSVWFWEAEAAGILGLSFGVFTRGEAVPPAGAVPIVDVLPEDHDLIVSDGANGVELAQEFISRRTA